jgi:membrane protease YdiL (CAAX protease family)
MGPGIAIFLSAGTFALAHMLAWSLPLHFLAGIVLSCAAYWSQSILPGIVLHSVWNGSLQLLELVDGAGDPPTGLGLGAQAALILLFLVTLVALFWMLRKLAPAPTPSPTPLSDRRTVATSAG